MRILIAAMAATAAFLVATASPVLAQGQNVVAEVEKYFNSLRTLQSRFVQSNPGGTVVQGTLSVRRPGRMRFEYDPPSQLKIVADGIQVTMWDIANRDFGQWPIGWTAASFLVKEPMVLQGGDLVVEKIDRADGMLHLTISQARKPQEGKVIVRLSENPMTLRGWTIIDNRGQRVDVSLNGLQTDLHSRVLDGARIICSEAGIPLAGGHSIDTTEPIFGLSVTGQVATNQLKRNNTAREGNWLLLTKPLGAGILSTAQKRSLLLPEHSDAWMQQLTSLNKIGEQLGKISGVQAMTDVTGFGLLGHLIEMCTGAGLSAEIYYAKLKLLLVATCT